MSKTLTAHDLRGLSRDQLNAKVVELKEELFGLRFQAATGQLESSARLRPQLRTQEPEHADSSSSEVP